jgi:hypothetical protein
VLVPERLLWLLRRDHVQLLRLRERVLLSDATDDTEGKGKRKRKRKPIAPLDSPQAIARWSGSVASALERGRSEEEIRAKLASKGLNESQIDDVIDDARETVERSMNAPDPEGSSGTNDVFVGSLWAGGGVLLTALTFGTTHGVVFYGAILYGGYRILRGLARK